MKPRNERSGKPKSFLTRPRRCFKRMDTFASSMNFISNGRRLLLILCRGQFRLALRIKSNPALGLVLSHDVSIPNVRRRDRKQSTNLGSVFVDGTEAILVVPMGALEKQFAAGSAIITGSR